MKTERIICTQCDIIFENEKELAHLPADDYGDYFLGCHKCCTNMSLKRLKYKKYRDKNRWWMKKKMNLNQTKNT